MAKGGFPLNSVAEWIWVIWWNKCKKCKELENTQKCWTKKFLQPGGESAVEVTVNGKVLSIKLDPEVVDPDDIEMLQDLIMTAINEANRRLKKTWFRN